MQLHPIEMTPLAPLTSATSAVGNQRLAALSGVKASLTVVAGQVDSTVGAVLALKEGELMTLDTPLNAPFDLMLGTTLIARGELVAVGDQLGLRITQVQEPKEA